MASTHRMGRSLGWLLACLLPAAVGCDDDTAADNGTTHDADHDADHGAEHSDADTAEHDAMHGAAGSGEHSHDGTTMVGPLTGAVCPDGSTLTYDNFGKKFMQDYCLRCHSESVTGDARNGAPGDHNFDALSDVDLLKAHIDEYAGSGPMATNTKMPPSDPKPSMEERQKLSEWIACGVPEN